VVTPFTESLDPIKAYECLAVGRPTVATPVAGFRDAGPPVAVAPAEGFAAAVDAALVTDAPARPVAVPTWAERADAFAAELAAARGAPVDRPLVVYLDHCARLSGAEIALARLLQAAPAVDPHVILGEHGPLEARLRALGVPVEVLEMDRDVVDLPRGAVTVGALGLKQAALGARDMARLRRRLVELRPDLVHTNSLKAAVWGGVAGRLAGVPVLWHVRDRIAPDYLPPSAVRLVRSMARVIPSAIVANSAATLATVGGPRAGVVVPDMVPAVAIPAGGTTTRRVADGRPFRMAMIGRLAPWKGQDVFVAAFARAFPSGSHRAVIVGSALFGEEEYAKGLPALAEELGVGDRVELRGFVEDVGAVLADVDCLVHASRIAEPFGQVVVEGMAAGLPVVAVDLGGPREIVTDEVDGLLFPVGDVDALADRLARLAADPALRARLATAAHQRAEDYTPAAIVPRWDEIYRGVVGRRSRAASRRSYTDS
jgi:glycosyltransferase involved in cell wall biosynthesis